jgi:hypothetical protein
MCLCDTAFQQIAVGLARSARACQGPGPMMRFATCVLRDPGPAAHRPRVRRAAHGVFWGALILVGCSGGAPRVSNLSDNAGGRRARSNAVHINKGEGQGAAPPRAAAGARPGLSLLQARTRAGRVGLDGYFSSALEALLRHIKKQRARPHSCEFRDPTRVTHHTACVRLSKPTHIDLRPRPAAAEPGWQRTRACAARASGRAGTRRCQQRTAWHSAPWC